MGVDEALLASAVAGRSTLRLYTWDGPWLSLGYGQRCGSGLALACREANVGLVRRATGGRAVLHGGDLTYAIAAPEGSLPPGVRGSYGKVAEVLLGALAAVGVAAVQTPGGSRSNEPPVGPESGPESDGLSAPRAPSAPFDCFEAPAADEICLNGAKLAGSAQRRAGGAVLQHGSIRLTPDPEAAARAVGLLGPGATSLLESGHRVAESDLRRAAVESFRAVLQVAVVPDSLSVAEESMARARVRNHSHDPFFRPQLPR